MLLMSGIDYSLASVETREKFSFTKTEQAQIYEKLLGQAGISGAVIVSTCNRTELYLSLDGEIKNPFSLLCKLIGEDESCYKSKTRQGKELFYHICRLSCGAKSQIWGEDQIISQVKASVLLSREIGAIDKELEVLFRIAVTCAKKIKTEIKFSHQDSSVASNVQRLIEGYTKKIDSLLVIGNGEAGRLVAGRLVEKGYRVSMTLRRYKHGEIIIPNRVSVLDYRDRYIHLWEFDCIISATLSPHYTLKREYINGFSGLILDIAMPRDVDPSIGFIDGIDLYNIDQIGATELEAAHKSELEQIDAVIEKYYIDYQRWRSYSTDNEKLTMKYAGSFNND